MERISLARGTRAEIIAELNALGQDALQAGKQNKAEGFAQALRFIELDGDKMVEIGFRRYEITD